VRREKRTSNFIAISCHASVRRYPPENWEATTGVQIARRKLFEHPPPSFSQQKL